MPILDIPMLDKSLFTYTSLFCEENIWKLIQFLKSDKKPDKNNIEPLDVLFISNKSKSVVLFEQKSAIGNQAVIWDYHVILTACTNNHIYALDFDSKCAFPLLISKYFKRTFTLPENTPEQYLPLLKTYKADFFLKYFYSDRSHMQGIIPESEFPEYSIIQPELGLERLTLQECIDTTIKTVDSEIYTPEDYLALLSGSESSKEK